MSGWGGGRGGPNGGGGDGFENQKTGGGADHPGRGQNKTKKLIFGSDCRFTPTATGGTGERPPKKKPFWQSGKAKVGLSGGRGGGGTGRVWT